MRVTLQRLWPPRISRRAPTPVELFGHADRLRRAGRYAEAAELVFRGLDQDPDSITGHLLAAYLYVARRTIEPAKQEFRWVLERDASHPRALLGLARIALEEGDVAGGREALARALHAYPDFPEAQAVLDGLAAPRPAPPPSRLRLDRLRLPTAARALVVVAGAGAVVAAQPEGASEAGLCLARTAGFAAAALQRAGFGPLRRAIVADTVDLHFLRTDVTLMLMVTLPRTTPITQGLLEVNRLWAAAQHELAIARDDVVETPAPAGAGRVS